MQSHLQQDRNDIGPGGSFSLAVMERPVALRQLDQVGAAEHLLWLEIPAAPDPVIEAVQGFRLLERAPRHGAHNAVQVPAAAHPQEYLLVPGS
jgi:hypothetical protein